MAAHEHEHGHEYGGKPVGHSALAARHDVRQVLAVVLGPLAVLLDLQIKYLLVQVWACKSPAASFWVLHGVAFTMLLVALAGGALALKEWHRAGREDPGDLGGREGRTRVNAAMGLGLSALSAVLIVAMWMPHFIIGPCQP